MLYDAQSRPLSSAGGEQVFYDGLDRVTARGNDGHGVQAPDYQMPVYDGWNIVEYYDTVTGKQALYVHDPFTDEILCKINGDNTRVYYQQDGLESAVALSDVTGNVTERYSYDIYGAPSFKDASGNVTQSSTANNRFLFTGREWLGSSNLYDYRTRIYSQKLGRLLQSDSVGFAAGDVNLYRYVSNSPLNYTDPTGQGYVDCGRAIARLLASVGRLEKRLAEAAADVHCTGLDPEHEKAIRDAMTQVKDDLAVVAQHCGVLGEYAVIAALAALLGAEIALA